MTMNIAALALLDGLAYASLLFLVAVGLTLIFGVLGILNVAHGSLYAIGAYATATLGQWLVAQGFNPWLTFPGMIVAAVAVGVLLGGLIERLLLQRIYSKDPVLQLLVTFAVSPQKVFESEDAKPQKFEGGNQGFRFHLVRDEGTWQVQDLTPR